MTDTMRKAFIALLCVAVMFVVLMNAQLQDSSGLPPRIAAVPYSGESIAAAVTSARRRGDVRDGAVEAADTPSMVLLRGAVREEVLRARTALRSWLRNLDSDDGELQKELPTMESKSVLVVSERASKWRLAFMGTGVQRTSVESHPSFDDRIRRLAVILPSVFVVGVLYDDLTTNLFIRHFLHPWQVFVQAKDLVEELVHSQTVLFPTTAPVLTLTIRCLLNLQSLDRKRFLRWLLWHGSIPHSNRENGTF